MNIYEVLTILFIHWFADFVLQTDKQAKGKSKNMNDLIDHTHSYSIIWLMVGSIYCLYYNLGPYKAVYFYLITFICHTATDYVTSRINSRLYDEGKRHTFFVSIGFDQWLHYVQLFLTYTLLK